MCGVCSAWCGVQCSVVCQPSSGSDTAASPAQAASSSSYLHINCWSPHCRGTLGTLALVLCIYTCCTGPSYT